MPKKTWSNLFNKDNKLDKKVKRDLKSMNLKLKKSLMTKRRRENW